MVTRFCLTIAAPSGMSSDDRSGMVSGRPGFLTRSPLVCARGARKTAVDHPSKIVPARRFARDHRETWEWRNRPASNAPRLTVVKAAPNGAAAAQNHPARDRPDGARANRWGCLRCAGRG